MGKVQDHKRSAKSKRQVDRTTKKAQADDRFEVGGVVEACLPNVMFKIKVTESQVPQLVGKELLGTLDGKMKLFRIRVMPGDTIKGYVTKYDPKRCVITYRSTQNTSQSN